MSLELRHRSENLLAVNIESALRVLDGLNTMTAAVGRAADIIGQSLLAGGKLLCCGNGGSAADSAHFVAEITGRFLLDRPGFPAVDLTANHALVTALINDFPPEHVFARQIQALGQAGDVLAVFSTSGNATNIRLALEVAGAKGIKTIAFLGRDGGKCRGLADVELIVPATVTARIQEAHLLMYHTICEALDPALAGSANKA